MRNWLARIFEGRHGPDALCGVWFAAGLILSAVAWFTKNPILGWLVYLPWILALWRMFGRDSSRRREENRRFLCLWDTVKNAVVGFFLRLRNGTLFRRKPRMRVSDTGKFRHFQCPQCGQKLRVPLGRGRLAVTCPKCRHEFEITT